MNLFFKYCILAIFSTQLIGADFKDEKFKLNISYNDKSWEKVENETFRDRLTLRNFSKSVTLNIQAYRFNETITANGLVERRINAIYDGWQVLNSDKTNPMTLKKYNVSEGIGSVYRKPYLDESLKKKYHVVADLCLVVDDNLGIIVNFAADNMQAIINIKDEYANIMESFWYGDERPNIYFVKNNDQEWQTVNQGIFRSRYNNTDYQIYDVVNMSSTENISQDADLNQTYSLYNKNGNYLIDNNNLMFINNLDEFSKFKFNLRGKEIVLNDNGFFIIDKRGNLRISKYGSNFNLLNEFEYPQKVNDIFYNNGFFVFFSDKKIELIQNNEVKWTFNHNHKYSNYVAHNDILYLYNEDSTIHAINLNNGAFIDSSNSLKSFVKFSSDEFDENFQNLDILIQDENIVYLVTKFTEEQGRVFAYANISINDPEMLIQDFGIRTLHEDFRFIGTTKELLIVSYTKNDINKSQYLEALDIKTFEKVWGFKADNLSDFHITSNQLIALNDNNQLLVHNIKNGKLMYEIKLLESYSEKSLEEMANLKLSRLFLLDNRMLAIIQKNNNYKEAVVIR